MQALFLRSRACPLCYRITLAIRVLLAAGFLPTGLIKVMGHRFTSLAADSGPIGAFFEAMYQTGIYWQFIGAVQVIGAVLLLVPPAAHLGAAIVVSVLTNIVIITVSLGFIGTPFISVPMLAAGLWLIAWDYHRFHPMLSTAPWARPPTPAPLDPVERTALWIWSASLIGFFFLARGFGPNLMQLPLLTIGVSAAAAGVARFLYRAWRQRHWQRSTATGV